MKTWLTLGRDARRLVLWVLLVGLCSIGILLLASPRPASVSAQDSVDGTTLSGRIVDAQGNPVCHAEVSLLLNGQADSERTLRTGCGGVFLFVLDEPIESAHLSVTRPHYGVAELDVETAEVARLSAGGSVQLGELTLPRRITAGFWVASIVFALVLLLIALETLHNMLSALLGVCILFIISSGGGLIFPDLFIFSFEESLDYVDFEVIFLVLGMMIVIAAVEETGIFQWMTYQAYRLSGGRVWLLMLILMIITSVASALLDNVTTMLLMAPLTIQIALALEIDPLSLLLPEVLASNVGGISTLIGTPTNILIGSYAGLSFTDFLFNLTPGVIMALAVLMGFTLLRYRKQWSKSSSGPSDLLMERLERQGQIQKPQELRRAGAIFLLVLVGFLMAESLHLAPAVVALVGAVLMLIWVSTDIETMMQSVDWTTLIFFIALFILVGAIQEVGLLDLISMGIASIVGDNVTTAILVVAWSAALLSGVVANIPFTAAMLPVVDFLSRTVPGATSNALFYTLSVGSAMGGNSSLIGASANMVTAGIAERAGYRISYVEFLKVGLPATILTVAAGVGWLLIHF